MMWAPPAVQERGRLGLWERGWATEASAPGVGLCSLRTEQGLVPPQPAWAEQCPAGSEGGPPSPRMWDMRLSLGNSELPGASRRLPSAQSVTVYTGDATWALRRGRKLSTFGHHDSSLGAREPVEDNHGCPGNPLGEDRCEGTHSP